MKAAVAARPATRVGRLQGSATPARAGCRLSAAGQQGAEPVPTQGHPDVESPPTGALGAPAAAPVGQARRGAAVLVVVAKTAGAPGVPAASLARWAAAATWGRSAAPAAEAPPVAGSMVAALGPVEARASPPVQPGVRQGPALPSAMLWPGVLLARSG
ncbi:hypothetical protein [Mycolicibacterium sp. CBMA 226]|uniref:hypothetical protein n=1 Tax=Mycolicibacterium sp. CBMA 226 TaxID=2606611 RepID=UPI001FB76D04|nr:hypothetical protein [Mycolicibacterium sp. CBMA 226]